MKYDPHERYDEIRALANWWLFIDGGPQRQAIVRVLGDRNDILQEFTLAALRSLKYDVHGATFSTVCVKAFTQRVWTLIARGGARGRAERRAVKPTLIVHRNATTTDQYDPLPPATLRAELIAAVETLDDRAQYILKRRWFGRSMVTCRTLAKRLGISPQRVLQIQNEALETISRTFRFDGESLVRRPGDQAVDVYVLRLRDENGSRWVMFDTTRTLRGIERETRGQLANRWRKEFGTIRTLIRFRGTHRPSEAAATISSIKHPNPSPAGNTVDS